MQKPDAKRDEITLALTENQDILYNYLFLRLGGDDAARDVLQETNLAILKNWESLDTPEHFLPWAKSTASLAIRHYITDRQRDAAKVLFNSEAADAVAESLAEPAATEERYDEVDYRMLKECLDKLPPGKSRLVNRRYWDGRSVEEIAREEKLSASLVAVQLHRIRKALGDCIRRIRCRFEDGTLATPRETETAELFERVFKGSVPDGETLSRGLAADAALRREWLEAASVHAALLFHQRKLKCAFPNGIHAAGKNGPAATRHVSMRTMALAASLAALFFGGAVLWKNLEKKRIPAVSANIPPKPEKPCRLVDAAPTPASPFPANARMPRQEPEQGLGNQHPATPTVANSADSIHLSQADESPHPVSPHTSSSGLAVQARNIKEQETMNMTNRTLATALAATSFCAFAGDINIGYRENGDLFVPAGATSNFSGTAVISEGTLNKFGDGTLSLASSNLVGLSNAKLAVRQGTLALTASDPAPAKAQRPDAVLRQAAFWVDANTNVLSFASNGTTYVTAWLDAREPSTNAPYQYVRSVSMANFTNVLPELVLTNSAAGNIPAIFFGYDTSGRWMQWTATNDALADITGIYHVFLVRGIFKSNGFVLGANSGYPDFHSGCFGSISASGTYWATPGGMAFIPPLYNGRTYLNGKYIDGTSTSIQTGWQLQEVALSEFTAHNSNFFNDRNHWDLKRVGGDYLCEAIVFTNRLTESDRLSVQQYCMDKWIGRADSKTIEIDMANASTVRVDVAEGTGSDSTNFTFSGNGSIQKTGAGTFVISDTATSSAYNGEVSVEDGAMDMHVSIPVQVKTGKRVSAVGTLLSTADAPAGFFVKDGEGTVAIRSVPNSLTTLKVEAGVLALKRPVTNATVAAEIYGTLPNPSFEAVQQTVPRVFSVTGWTGIAPSGSSLFVYNHAAGIKDNLLMCPYYPPDGNQCLGVKLNSSIYTTLGLPCGGVYDITFYASGRGSYPPLALDFCIADNGTTNCFATVYAFSLPWYKQRVRTPWLSAGNHTLLLRNFCKDIDGTADWDDFKVTLVSTGQSGSSIPLKNGDFEVTSYSMIKGNNTYYPYYFATNNVAVGWSVDINTSGTVLAAPTRYACTLNSFYKQSANYGNVELGIYSNGQSSTALALPAGKYKLCADIARWFYKSNGFLALEAIITHPAGDTESLGSIQYAGVDLTTTCWPNSFVITNNETATLTVRGNGLNGAILADNFSAIPVETSNLLQDGGFESIGTWTYFKNTTALAKSYSTSFNLTTNNYLHYGTLPYEGGNVLRVTEEAGAFQSITLPKSGVYRLVMHIAQRKASYAGTYSPNPVRAWLVQNGATNVIGWTRSSSNPFTKHEFLFRAEAGTCTFGIQGMSNDTEEFPGTDRTVFIDNVSIKRVTDFTDEDFSLPKTTVVKVEKGARLQLDFTCTNKVADIYLGGKQVSGVIDQKTYPAYVSGPGALYTPSKGTVVMLK